MTLATLPCGPWKSMGHFEIISLVLEPLNKLLRKSSNNDLLQSFAHKEVRPLKVLLADG
jgi:hypothetical protein